MAVHRNTPKCPFCNEPVAKAIYNKRTKNFVGDTFIRWQYFDCNCVKSKALKRTRKDHMK